MIRPFIPNPDTVIPEVTDVGVPFQKPKQFINYTFQVNFFRGNKGESFLQIKTHLVAKTAFGTRSCPVSFYNAIIQNMPKQVEILLHYAKIVTSGLADRFKLSCCGELVDENCAGLLLEIECLVKHRWKCY
jgi:hypothetical protein